MKYNICRCFVETTGWIRLGSPFPCQYHRLLPRRACTEQAKRVEVWRRRDLNPYLKNRGARYLQA